MLRVLLLCLVSCCGSLDAASTIGKWSGSGKGDICVIGEGRAKLWVRSTGVIGSIERSGRTWLREYKLDFEFAEAGVAEVEKTLTGQQGKLAAVVIVPEPDWLSDLQNNNALVRWAAWAKAQNVPCFVVGLGLDGENFRDTQAQQDGIDKADRWFRDAAEKAGLVFVEVRTALKAASQQHNSAGRKYGGVTSNGKKLNRDGVETVKGLLAGALGIGGVGGSSGRSSSAGKVRALSADDIVVVIQDTLWSKHAGRDVPLGNRWVSAMVEGTKGIRNQHGQPPSFLPRRYDHFGNKKDEIVSILNIQGKEESLAQTAGETVVIMALSYAVVRTWFLKDGGQKAVDEHIAKHKPAWLASIKKFTSTGQLVVIVGVPEADEKIATLKKTGYDKMFQDIARQSGACYIPMKGIKGASEQAGRHILEQLGWYKPAH